MMKFENGALGVIDNSRAAHYGYDQRTEVHCDQGCEMCIRDSLRPDLLPYVDGSR